MPICGYSNAHSSLLGPYTHMDQFQKDPHRVQGNQLPFFKTRLCKGATWKTEPKSCLEALDLLQEI